MSVSIHSPLPTYSVFPSFHDSSLSPPPTPLAKRARHFFPSNSEASSSPPVPMFFPTSKSLLSHRSSSSSFHNSSSPRFLSPMRLHDRSHAAPTSPTFEKESIARRQLKDMARRPPPQLRLRPRPLHCNNKMRHTNGTKGKVDKAKQVDMDRIPSLPLWSPSDSSDDDTPRSYRSVPTPTPTTTANPEKVEPKDKPSQVEGEVIILDKPQRILKKSTSALDGLAKLPTFQRRGVRRVVTKRNSFAARSA